VYSVPIRQYIARDIKPTACIFTQRRRADNPSIASSFHEAQGLLKPLARPAEA
jgi:hypothetical protein